MQDTTTLAQEVIDLCKEKGLTLVTAESLTGGSIAATLVQIDGASDVLYGGYVTYQTSAKVQELGVCKETVEVLGTVSEACCLEMLQGASKRSGASVSIATTGIAGMDSYEGKPAGLVYIAVGNGDRNVCHRHILTGTRTEKIQQVVQIGLQYIIQYLRGETYDR